jgi:hypothetical protein
VHLASIFHLQHINVGKYCSSMNKFLIISDYDYSLHFYYIDLIIFLSQMVIFIGKIIYKRSRSSGLQTHI